MLALHATHTYAKAGEYKVSGSVGYKPGPCPVGALCMAPPETLLTGPVIKVSAGTPISKGTYQGYMDGRLFITTKDISRADALANCKRNESLNPSHSFRCTWNGEKIYESDTTPPPTIVASPATTGPAPLTVRFTMQSRTNLGAVWIDYGNGVSTKMNVEGGACESDSVPTMCSYIYYVQYTYRTAGAFNVKAMLTGDKDSFKGPTIIVTSNPVPKPIPSPATTTTRAVGAGNVAAAAAAVDMSTAPTVSIIASTAFKQGRNGTFNFPGGTMDIIWNAKNATSCSVSPAPKALSPRNFSATNARTQGYFLVKVTEDVTYTVTCVNRNGVSASA